MQDMYINKAEKALEKISYRNERVMIFEVFNICSSNQIISSTAKKLVHTSEVFHGQTELDSHADTTVEDCNCTILHHKERSCDVAPFSDRYEPMKDVDNVSANTGFT